MQGSRELPLGDFRVGVSFGRSRESGPADGSCRVTLVVRGFGPRLRSCGRACTHAQLNGQTLPRAAQKSDSRGCVNHLCPSTLRPTGGGGRVYSRQQNSGRDVSGEAVQSTSNDMFWSSCHGTGLLRVTAPTVSSYVRKPVLTGVCTYRL